MDLISFPSLELEWGVLSFTLLKLNPCVNDYNTCEWTQEVEEMRKEITEARRIKMLHEPSKVFFTFSEALYAYPEIDVRNNYT